MKMKMNTNTATNVVPHPSAVLDKRVTILVITSVINGLGQGDPDRDNAQRTDSAGYAYISPMGFKRKIRDYLALTGHPIFINRENVALETLIRQSIDASGIEYKGAIGDDSESDSEDSEEESAPKAPKAPKAKAPKGRKLTFEEKAKVAQDLCLKFTDNRFFGATLCNPVNQPLTGPVQVSWSVSVDPVEVLDWSITRVAVTKEDELHKERTMGRLSMIPFGLFRTEIDLNPAKAKVTGFTWGDFDTFMDAVKNMHEQSKSTGRSQVYIEKVIVFTHDTHLGNASSRSLRKRVKIARLNPTGVPANELPVARSVDDYEITVDMDGLSGVSVQVIEP